MEAKDQPLPDPPAQGDGATVQQGWVVMGKWAAGTSGQALAVLQLPVAPAAEWSWLGVSLIPFGLLAPLPAQGERTSPSPFLSNRDSQTDSHSALVPV